jgi:hypothetical protein
LPVDHADVDAACRALVALSTPHAQVQRGLTYARR